MKAIIRSPYNGPFTWEQIPYKVRYAELDPCHVYNNIAPPQEQIDSDPEFYGKLIRSIESEGIRNPVILVAARRIPNEEFAAMKDPIMEANHAWWNIIQAYDIGWGEAMVCYRKPLPDRWNGTDEPMIVCRHHGGSRCWAAQKMGIKIPAIVADFGDVLPLEPVLTSDAEIMATIPDTPPRITLVRDGPRFGIRHHHLGSDEDIAAWRKRSPMVNN